VTYIANEGFLLEAGDDKLIIDGLFGRERFDWCPLPTQAAVEKLAQAQAPFDGLDLILVTHAHVDHFDPGMMLDHLSHDPTVRVIGPTAVEDALREESGWTEDVAGRVDAIGLEPFQSAARTADGIRIEAHRVRHCAFMVTAERTGELRNRHEKVDHLMFVIEMGGMRMLHLGDAFLDQNPEVFESEYFANQRFDLIFLEGWTIESLEVLNRFVPAHVVLMHLPPELDAARRIVGKLTPLIPQAVAFERCLEQRRFTPATGG